MFQVLMGIISRAVSGAYAAVASNFDGTNDYMLRGGGLTGAVDGKQVLMSAWVNLNGETETAYFVSSTNDRCYIRYKSTDHFQFVVKGTIGTVLANMQTTSTYSAGATWYHIIASVDTGVANSGYVYVNDSAEVSAYDPLVDAVIDFTVVDWSVGADTAGASKANSCLSEIYIEDTYLDLSVEANRRKFIDASGKPVDLGSDGSTPTGASPLVYLPNPFGTFEENEGTGGDFTVTGALTECATSPSDDVSYEASASNFDGTNDYMLRGADLTGAADGSQILISAWVNLNGGDGTTLRVISNTNTRVSLSRGSGNKFSLSLRDASTNLLANMVASGASLSGSTWYHVIASIDTSVSNSGYMYINDAAEASAYDPLLSTDIDITAADWAVGAVTTGSNKMNGCLSEVYMEDTYLDLSVEANRRKFIDASGKPVDLGADGSTPTGASPLVYLPNPFGTFHENEGTGGDFTVTGALTECADSPSD